jgi:hypothetical protein
VTGGVTAVLRRAGKVAAGIAPAALMVRLGLPALGALVFLAVLAAGVTCWLLGSDAPGRPGQPGAAGLAGQPRLPDRRRRLRISTPGAASAPLALAAAPVADVGGYSILVPMSSRVSSCSTWKWDNA